MPTNEIVACNIVSNLNSNLIFQVLECDIGTFSKLLLNVKNNVLVNSPLKASYWFKQGVTVNSFVEI